MTAERKEIASAPGAPPDDYRLHRVVTANDVAPFKVKAHGIVMNEHKEALIQVCPEGGAAPAVSVLFWSEGANAGDGQFIEDHTPIAFAAKAVNTPWEAVVPCYGRRMLVAVTAGGAVGETRIYVAGHNENLGR